MKLNYTLNNLWVIEKIKKLNVKTKHFKDYGIYPKQKRKLGRTKHTP